ncbi:MAG: aminoglycoside phosphotransferase family protein [Hamadaea sp.]|nr:aminoglycoside phosphotransferase family protein [Hamadaea sp.]
MSTLPIDTDLVRRLIRAQFPQWAHLPIRPVDHGGWDNRTFHLGDAMTVRLPSSAAYQWQVEKEHRWLPALAAHLPLPIPAPIGRGVPGEGYPLPWSVYGWIDGEQAAPERIRDLTEFAGDLAAFLVALAKADPADGPGPGAHNFWRGGPLTTYDGETREALAALGDLVPAVATEIWEAALAASWEGRPVWFHGDIAYGNLLVRDGRLAAVIDFGTSGVGDPACDLAISWTMFSGESRQVFRDTLGVDPGTWARGRGWTLWKALIVYAEHRDKHPAKAAEQRRVLDEIFTEYAGYTGSRG